MKMKKISLAVILASASGSVVAAESDKQDSKVVLPSVTVSASPIHQHDTFEVPSQVDALTGEQKAQKESGSLGAMLEHIPGVNNQSAGSQSGKPVVRGLTGNRVKVLSNGQTTDYQAYGTRHNPNMDPYLADRIEVIRGPQSVLYGSEAMGGVVNVLQPELPYEQSEHGEFAAEYNSNNQEKMLGAKVGAGSENFAVNAGFSIRDADNITVPNDGSNQPLFVGEVPFTNFENRALNIGLGYQEEWGNIELRYTNWLSKQNYLGIERHDGEFEAVAAGQELENSEAQLTAEFFVGNDWVVKPSWSHTRNQRQASHDEPFEHMFEEEHDEDHDEHEEHEEHGLLDILVKRDDFKLAVEHPKVGDFEGEIGLELTEKQQVLRSGHLTPSADVSKRAVYLFEEADYDKWLVQFGARYDWHDVKAPLDGNNEHFVDEMGVFDATNNDQSFSVASGSLGATYTLDKEWSVAASLARGFRAPTIFELYAGGMHGGVQAFQIGNPNLEEEISLNMDLSLRWKTANTRMTATVYQNTIDNYIYLANTGFYRAVEGAPNEGERVDATAPGAIVEMQAEQTDARIHGVEFALQHRFNSQWSTDLGIELIKGEDTANNQDLPLIPANNARVAVHYEPGDMASLRNQKWSLNAKLVDAKDAAGAYEPFSQFDNMPTGTASTDAYAVWGLGYQAQVKFDQQTLKLSASVENLFDTDYVDFLNTYKGYTLNQGRNIKLGVRMDF